MTHRLIPSALLILIVSGCAGYSMHSMYPVTISVSEIDSSKRLSGATKSISYDYDSYGWFLFGNKSNDVFGVTNKEGVFSTEMADYRYRIIMRVNGLPAGDFGRELVLQGGVLKVPPRQPMYLVQVSPR